MSASEKPFGADWIAEYFAMVDRRDLDEFLTWYHDDAHFRFGNHPPASGKAAIRQALEQFYASISSMRHEQTGVWSNVDSGAFEAIAHFETKAGKKLALPAVSTLRVRDGLIHDFRLVMDAAPIMGDAAS